VNRDSPGGDVSLDVRGPTRAALRGAFAVVIVVLGVVNVLDHEIHGIAVWLAVPGAAVLIGIARSIRLSWDDIGLSKDHLRAGVLYAAAAIALVSVIYGIALLIPATRRGFLDSRYHVSTAAALVTAFVRIPLGTILFEEVAFRGVLWGVVARLRSPGYALLVTSGLFGLWHVLPSLHLASANSGVRDAVGGSSGGASVLAVVGAVVLTAVGGFVFGEMRRRSGSLVAGAGAHWATNGLGVLFGLLAWHVQ
jgi:membrane protease YdiL (CAAX protease family)